MIKSDTPRIVKYPLYTIGDLSSGIYGIGPAILLMFYMTNILGIPIAIATIAASLPKFLDLLFSPLVGSISDRTKSRYGRRRPYLLASSILMFPLFVGIWAAPFTDPVASAWFIATMYVACSLSYTAFLVPYAALNSEIATDYNDTTALNSYRATYSMLGCLLAGAGAPMLVDVFGGGRTGYLGMGVTLAAVMSVSMLITFYNSKEPARVVDVERITFVQVYRALLKNKAFFVLTLTYVLHMTAGGVISTGLAYFVTYILLKDTSLLAGMFFLTFGASVVCIPVFLYLGKRVSKHTIFTICLIIAILAAGLFFALDGESSLAMIYGTGAAIGVAEGAIQAYAYAMLSDCIRHGDQRQGAMLTGVFIAFEKLAVALGSLIAGTIFSLSGLIETVDGTTTQPDSAISGIQISVTIVPIILNIAAIAIFYLYRNFDRFVASTDSDNTHYPRIDKDNRILTSLQPTAK
ncbi:MFS transporter [Pseudomonas mediterranea]|uniref:MFS transporter n=1 Tax=Pseudomonas mediterranea TaxID=183795 RepID=UPI0009E7BE70|nr:MFS transporter [Pseudomonas mediterranea]MDU9027489.1 MFS transporter [Pseudomonas mediterranea]